MNRRRYARGPLAETAQLSNREAGLRNCEAGLRNREAGLSYREAGLSYRETGLSYQETELIREALSELSPLKGFEPVILSEALAGSLE